MGKLGLVFAGGGGKGAYEIGVWKYLNEIGLDKHVTAISGTSVGALNAALFVGGTFENAYYVWCNISPGAITTAHKINKKDLFRIISGILEASISGDVLKYVVTSLRRNNLELIAQTFMNRILVEGFFSRDGMEEIIRNNIDFSKIQDSDVRCFATCLKVPSAFHPSCKVNPFEINNFDREKIIKILLASSALPIVFPEEKIDGKYYRDGGFKVIGDNVPIQPVYNAGVKDIIVVNLDHKASPTEKEKYKYSRIVDIIPSKDLGNLITGTMDFHGMYDKSTKKRIEKGKMEITERIDLGYKDAKRIIEKAFKGETRYGHSF